MISFNRDRLPALTEELERLSFAQAPRTQRHMIRAEMRHQEKRGDVQVFWQECRYMGEQYVVPYVRVRSVEEVKRRLRVRIGAGVVLGGSALVSLVMALWEARWVLLCLAGGVLLLAAGFALLGLLLRHRPGCTGLHCPGCRG
jgi:hypothetical protein